MGKTNKELELFNLERFLNQQGIVTTTIFQPKPPDPDFLIQLDGRTIGVELARVYKVHPSKFDSHSKSSWSLSQAVEGYTDSLLSKARGLYFDNFPILVKIVFSTHISQEQIKDKLAKLIACAVKKMTAEMVLQGLSVADWKPGAQENEEETVDENPLAELVYSIHVRRVPEMRFARWQAVRSGLTGKLTLEHLQSAINKKAAKIKYYMSAMDEKWLLLVSDRRLPSQMLEIPKDLPLEQVRNPFDKVFYHSFGANQPVLELSKSSATPKL